MGFLDWLNRFGNEVTVDVDGDEYIELDIVAPYELPMIDQVLVDGGIAVRQIPTYDAAIGLDRIQLLVTRDDLQRSSDILRRLRGGKDPE